MSTGTTKFWTNAPDASRLGPTSTCCQPGEARGYIPVVTFGVPENTPAGGLVGKTVSMEGTKRVSFIARGRKTEGTKL
jgi:hypothetical protein